MRVHINKVLKTWWKAIQTALRKYNTAASVLGHPHLDWKNISTYGSLAEFSLLRECQTDIRQQPWAVASNQQAAVYDLKIQGVLVEQTCLNVEIRHLATSIYDEEENFAKVITSTRLTDLHLATELEDIVSCHMHINEVHRRHIAQIYALPTFNGVKTLGWRIGRAGRAQVTQDLEMVDGTGIGMHNDVDRDEEIGDEELDNYLQFMDNLSTDLNE